MSEPLFLLAAAIILVGATIQGVAGFGMNVLGAPLLFLIEPSLVPGSIILAALLHTVLSAWRERGEINFRMVSWMFAGTVPGILAGAMALRILSEDGSALLIAAVILGAVAIMTFGLVPKFNRATTAATGLVAGFSGSTSAVSGPVIALFLSQMPGPQLRSTMASYFLIAGSISLVTLSLVGEFGAEQFARGLLLWPAVGIGFLLSSPLRKYLDRGYVRPAILAISACAAISLLVRALV